jgi:hypothetical protein
MPSAFSWPLLVPYAPSVLRRRLPWALGLFFSSPYLLVTRIQTQGVQMEESVLMIASDAISLAIAKFLQLFGVSEQRAIKAAPFAFLALVLAAAFAAWFYVSGSS